MMLPQDSVPVAVERLESLEREHQFLELIRDKNQEVAQAQAAWEEAREHAKTLKDAFAKCSEELSRLISAGPPKPDAQGLLPFAEDAGPVVLPIAGDAAAQEIEIPADIEALDLTELQKRKLAGTGAKTVADLISLGNGNWPDYPDGFNSIEGFGPKAAARVAAQLPSSAAEPEPAKGEKTVRVRLLGFGAAAHLQPGNEYEALMLEDGSVIIQLPGHEPVQFSAHEYDLAEAVPA
jgi:hypothetical protein